MMFEASLSDQELVWLKLCLGHSAKFSALQPVQVSDGVRAGVFVVSNEDGAFLIEMAAHPLSTSQAWVGPEDEADYFKLLIAGPELAAAVRPSRQRALLLREARDFLSPGPIVRIDVLESVRAGNAMRYDLGCNFWCAENSVISLQGVTENFASIVLSYEPLKTASLGAGENRIRMSLH